MCGGNSFGEVGQQSNGMKITHQHRAPFRATNQVQVLSAWGRGGFSVPAAHDQEVSIQGRGQTAFKRILQKPYVCAKTYCPLSFLGLAKCAAPFFFLVVFLNWKQCNNQGETATAATPSINPANRDTEDRNEVWTFPTMVPYTMTAFEGPAGHFKEPGSSGI